jgi:hypothetical protein
MTAVLAAYDANDEWAEAGAAFASPLFDAVSDDLASFDRFPVIAELNALAVARSLSLSGENGDPLRFAAAAPATKGLRVAGDGYEGRIRRDGQIETRPDDWHDLFNALAWLAWPRCKAALNALHVREMQLDDAAHATHRGVARDLATLFDEGGAVLACGDRMLTQLLREFRWRELFVDRRAQVQSKMRCYVFGHALLDRARNPYKSMTAHALIFPVASEFFLQPVVQQVKSLDTTLAAWFADPENTGSTQRLSPLPVMGFPGFCAANCDPEYYNDINVFRPGRMRQHVGAAN